MMVMMMMMMVMMVMILTTTANEDNLHLNALRSTSICYCLGLVQEDRKLGLIPFYVSADNIMCLCHFQCGHHGYTHFLTS